MWFLKRKKINFNQYLTNIEKVVNKNKEELISDGTRKEVKHLITILSDFVRYQTGNSVIPYELRKVLERLLKELTFLKNQLNKQALSKKELLEVIEEIINDYRAAFSHRITYLIRHPDPHESSYTSNPERNLTKKGVEQIMRFSKKLIALILLAPEPVELKIITSKNKRALLFAESFLKLLEKDKKRFSKRMELSVVKSEALTNNFVSDDMKRFLKEKYPDQNTKNLLFENFPKYLKEWLESNSDEMNKICLEITTLVKHAAQESCEAGKLCITILFSHLPNIASYLGMGGTSIELAPAEYLLFLDGNLVKV